MSNIHRQKPQYPAFQVMWSCDHRRLPLQIRNFTSDSYRALKERDGKRERRQRSKRWHDAQERSDHNKRPSEKAVEVPRMSVEPDGGVISLDSDISLPPLQDESTAQASSKRNLDLLRSLRESLCEARPIELSRCSPAAVSRASPSPDPVSIHCGHLGESRHSCDTFVEPSHDESMPSTRTPDEAFSHEAGKSEELPCDANGPDNHAADSSPSVSALTSGPSTGSELGSPDGEIDVNRSLRLAALQSHSKGQRGPATNTERTNPVSTEPLWYDNPRNQEIVRPRHGPIRSSRKGWKLDSGSQVAWNYGLNEHLLHLRDVAQLDWHTLVTYFPGTTPNGVRQRYRQLKKMAAADRALDDDRSSQCCDGSVTHLSTEYCWGNAQAPKIKTHHADPASRAKKAASTPRCLARRRRPNAQADGVEPALPSTTPSAHRDPERRTSRCGRTIRHPFRHRPSEGYL